MEKEKLGQDSAFPCEVGCDENGIKELQTGDHSFMTFGMSKRLFLAGMAMQGLLANPHIKRPHPQDGDLEKQHESFSSIAFEFADSLLKAEQL